MPSCTAITDTGQNMDPPDNVLQYIQHSSLNRISSHTRLNQKAKFMIFFFQVVLQHYSQLFWTES